VTGGRSRFLTGDWAFWTIVLFAAAFRGIVVVAACCVVASLVDRVDTSGIAALWSGEPSALPATVLAAIAVTGLAVGSVEAARRAWATIVFRFRVRSAAAALPEDVRHATEQAGLRDRVVVVADCEPFALTYGLLRPRVLVSTGLLRLVEEAELAAVLAHEREHVRGRDPLKTAVVRVLVGRLIVFPLVREFADRFAVGREMAADRRAVSLCGRRAVVSALLKAVDHPGWAAAPSAAMGSAEMLDARITQLETGTAAPPGLISRTRLGVSIAAAVVLAWAVAGAVTMAVHEHGRRCHSVASAAALAGVPAADQ
jgi:Zn-dependent protease with chaperone function